MSEPPSLRDAATAAAFTARRNRHAPCRNERARKGVEPISQRAEAQPFSRSWSPTVRFIEGTKPGEIAEWNAEKDFSGTVADKQMEAWEKFAQVLLETNEMTFVN